MRRRSSSSSQTRSSTWGGSAMGRLPTVGFPGKSSNEPFGHMAQYSMTDRRNHRPSGRGAGLRGRLAHASRRAGERRLDFAGRADVAQLVEHFTRNEGVAGSSPAVGFPLSNSHGAWRSAGPVSRRVKCSLPHLGAFWGVRPSIRPFATRLGGAPRNLGGCRGIRIASPRRRSRSARGRRSLRGGWGRALARVAGSTSAPPMSSASNTCRELVKRLPAAACGDGGIGVPPLVLPACRRPARP